MMNEKSFLGELGTLLTILLLFFFCLGAVSKVNRL